MSNAAWSPLLVWGGVAALLLFWSVGAYNRLVRLRTKVLSIFTSLTAQFERYAGWLAAHAPPALPQGVAPRPGDAWSNLRAAGAQFAASLDAVRGKPMDGGAVAGLATAHAVLMMAWQQLDDETLARGRGGLPGAQLRSEWEAITTQVHAAEKAYVLAVDAYNGAVTQFPALLLARLFGFRRARRR